MRLRTKLLCGYIVFIAALVALGGCSGWRLRDMGGVSRRIIADNYDSVVAAQDMQASLERQDSAALFALLGQHQRARTQVQAHRQQFDAAFEKAANNITELGEQELIEAIRRGQDTDHQLFEAFSGPRPSSCQWIARLVAPPISPDSNRFFISSGGVVTACCA